MITVDVGECRDWGVAGAQCPGRVRVIDVDDGQLIFSCDECGYEAAKHRRKVSSEILAAVDEQMSEEQGAHAARERAQAVRRRRKESGMGEQLQAITFSALDSNTPPAALEAAKRFASGDTSGLLLGGPVGAGKTTLAAAASNELMERRPLRWFTANRLFGLLDLRYENPERERVAEALVSEGERSVALAIDELDKARATEYAASQLFGVIDEKITAGAPLLVTTNLELPKLAARYPEPYGEAIVSRLAGYCEAFAIDGPDRRLTRFAA